LHGELEDAPPANVVEGPDLFQPEATAKDAEPSSIAEAPVEEAMSPEGAA